VATLHALMLEGKVQAETVEKAIRQYGIDPERIEPREA